MEGEGMKIFAVIGSNSQTIDEVNFGPPEGYVLMASTRPEGEDTLDYTAQPDGTWAITQETLNAKLIPIETSWRDAQMPIAQQNVTAIEYGEPGDAQAWKSYWLALRKWTADNPDFPDSSKRPVAPT